RPDGSIARRWNEQILNAIRRDTPRPPVHARNLFHVAAAMWDAWAAYDATADGYFVHDKATATDIAVARQEAISYAAYRVMRHRYADPLAVGFAVSQSCFTAFMTKLGYDPQDETTTGDSPRALGNRIAQAIIAAGLTDGANEQRNYADTTGWTSSNPPLVVDAGGNQLSDPSTWQQLNLAVAETQNGIPVAAGVQVYVGAHWGEVTPFAMTRPAPGALYHDPGPPPTFGPALVPTLVDLITRAAQLDAGFTETIDISPGAYGNNTLGHNDGPGHPINPVTGAPYAANVVKRGDFGRVLAEFWADGPNSETPPGHWDTLANAVADHPDHARKLFGGGASVDPLEWDVKVYFALNAATHDAGIAAWEIKRRLLGNRPICWIRYMASLGQSSDPALPSHHPDGLPLVPGLIELVTVETTQPGQRHAHLKRYLGQVAVRAWRGEPGNRTSEVGGVDWIRGAEWIPYQRRTFVTPAFPGFVSGHSTFSRAAAEVLTGITGITAFPGGLGEFKAPARGYLVFEQGPAADVVLQWGTYYDAADQAGQSRLWGGIHIEPDDLTGRIIGSQVGLAALARARTYYDGTAVP
ncbi:MAG: vanadium-dependent haloperoxidase, partial [Myxococcales bacterium]|nr:vanadium-dependent haloperoxidase [Myxococcales bacterium]